jgi:periplasmic mercuric ion binding protein
MLVSMTLALGALASPALAGETTVTLAVRNWYCAACPHVIKQSLAAVPGVINVTVSDKTKTASVTFEDTKTDVKSLTQATAEAGYPSFPSYGRDAVAVKFAQNMGVSSAVETTIPEGTKLEINGFAVVPVGINNPSSGPEANQHSFDLLYDTWSTDEHEANGPGGSFFWIFAIGESLFGGPKLGSKNIDLIKTNPPEKTWSVTDNCKALSFK